MAEPLFHAIRIGRSAACVNKDTYKVSVHQRHHGVSCCVTDGRIDVSSRQTRVYVNWFAVFNLYIAYAKFKVSNLSRRSKDSQGRQQNVQKRVVRSVKVNSNITIPPTAYDFPFVFLAVTTLCPMLKKFSILQGSAVTFFRCGG